MGEREEVSYQFVDGAAADTDVEGVTLVGEFLLANKDRTTIDAGVKRRYAAAIKALGSVMPTKCAVVGCDEAYCDTAHVVLLGRVGVPAPAVRQVEVDHCYLAPFCGRHNRSDTRPVCLDRSVALSYRTKPGTTLVGRSQREFVYAPLFLAPRDAARQLFRDMLAIWEFPSAASRPMLYYCRCVQHWEEDPMLRHRHGGDECDGFLLRRCIQVASHAAALPADVAAARAGSAVTAEAAEWHRRCEARKAELRESTRPRDLDAALGEWRREEAARLLAEHHPRDRFVRDHTSHRPRAPPPPPPPQPPQRPPRGGGGGVGGAEERQVAEAAVAHFGGVDERWLREKGDARRAWDAAARRLRECAAEGAWAESRGEWAALNALVDAVAVTDATYHSKCRASGRPEAPASARPTRFEPPTPPPPARSAPVTPPRPPPTTPPLPAPPPRPTPPPAPPAAVVPHSPADPAGAGGRPPTAGGGGRDGVREVAEAAVAHFEGVDALWLRERGDPRRAWDAGVRRLREMFDAGAWAECRREWAALNALVDAVAVTDATYRGKCNASGRPADSRTPRPMQFLPA